MKVALYSAIYGGYDKPKVVPADLGVPAYMFTGEHDTAQLAVDAGWHVMFDDLTNREMTPMMQHKYWKLHPHIAVPNVDVSLWLDGSMTITVDNYVERCLEALGDDDWVMVKHPWRDCVYTEGRYSSTLPRYDQWTMLEQIHYYASIGHPAGWGLFATGANVRRHTPAVRELCEHWWWENTYRSHQDQLSLPVVLRLMGDKIKWNTKMPWHEWWHLAEHGG